MSRPARLRRSDFRWFCSVPSRWDDNDAYGHVNNVVYLSWIDTAVNRWLLQSGLIDVALSPEIFFVVENGCLFFEGVAYPENVEVGIAVDRVGGSSVAYSAAVFREAGEEAVAQGRYVHVLVDRATERPVTIPEWMRAKFASVLR
jgi:acyl-CoA thioester hydrolase